MSGIRQRNVEVPWHEDTSGSTFLPFLGGIAMDARMISTLPLLLSLCIGEAFGQHDRLPAAWAKRIQREVQEESRVLRAASAEEGCRPDLAAIDWYCRLWTLQVAEALPIDWFLHRQIVKPLQKRHFIPEYVSDIEPLSDPNNVTFLRLSYEPAFKPETVFRDGKSVSFEDGGSRQMGGADLTFTLARAVCQAGGKTTAELFSRRRVKRQKDGATCQLFVFEVYEFNPTSGDWKLTGREHYFQDGGKKSDGGTGVFSGDLRSKPP